MESSVAKLAKYIRLYNIDNCLPQINGYIKALSLNGKQVFDEVQLTQLIPEIHPVIMTTFLGLLSDMELLEFCPPNIGVKNIKELDNLLDHLIFLFEHGLLNGLREETRLLWTPPKRVPIKDDKIRFERIDTFIHKLIQKTRSDIVFFAPFYTEGGTNIICDSLLPLLRNQPSVKVTMISSSLDSNGKRNRNAFVKMAANLGQLIQRVHIYASLGADLPLHAKFVISDSCQGILSSANFSISGFAGQIEIGARITANQCRDLSWLVQKILERKLVEKVEVL